MLLLCQRSFVFRPTILSILPSDFIHRLICRADAAMLCLSGAVPMLSLLLPMPFRCSCLSSVMCVPLLTVLVLLSTGLAFRMLLLPCPVPMLLLLPI